MDKKRDKRNFKRYKKEAETIVKAGARQYRGSILDYSDGVCAIIKNTSSISSGTRVHIKSEALDLDFLGEIVWAKKVPPGLQVGVRRLDNLRGSLKEFQLPDILMGLQKTSSTGTLEVTNDRTRKRIFIKDGHIIFAASDTAEGSLAEMLLHNGKLSLEQYKEVINKAKDTGKSQSTIVAELGYLSPQDLVWALKHQVEGIILETFNIRDASFEFQEGPLTAEESIPLRLNSENLLFHGYKKVNDLLYLREECPPQDTELRLVKPPEELLGRISVSEYDKRVLAYLDGKHSIKEILSRSELNDVDVLKTIYALLNIGAVEPADETAGTPETAEPAESVIDKEVLERIEEMYRKHRDLGYYGILGINEEASDEEIREAYHRVAKEFHPDRYYSLSSESLKEKLNTIFTYATEAYQTLSNAQKKKEYDERNRPVTVTASPGISKTEEAKSKFHEGRAALMMRNYSGAATLFAQAVYFDSSVASYHYYYGLALSQMEMLKEAAQSFSKAIELNPKKADYVAELGHVFLKLGFKARAHGTFKRALELSPTNERAIEGLLKTEENKKSFFASPENILQKITKKYNLKRRR